MLIHTIFDVLAAVSALAMSLAVYRWRLSEQGDRITRAGPGYLIALIVGATVGGYGFGTLNLWASGLPGIGRSIVGAMAGAIVAIELYKWRAGITGSTGAGQGLGSCRTFGGLGFAVARTDNPARLHAACENADNRRVLHADHHII